MPPLTAGGRPHLSLKTRIPERVIPPLTAAGQPHLSLKTRIPERVIATINSWRPASPVPEDEDPGGADAEKDVKVLRVLGRVQGHPVHGQLLGVLQVLHLSLGRGQAPDTRGVTGLQTAQRLMVLES